MDGFWGVGTASSSAACPSAQTRKRQTIQPPNRPTAQVYYLYTFLLLVVMILIIVNACVTIVGTYFLLNAENYHWQAR